MSVSNSKSVSKSNLLLCLAITFIYVSLTGCAALTETPKYQFVDGYYYTKTSDRTPRKSYVVVTDDTIKVYEAKRKTIIDTVHEINLVLPSQQKLKVAKDYQFSQRTFDVDVLSILFKYRPAVKDFPNQFNTTFNGAVYLGYRTDIYKLAYRKTPFGSYKRQTNHYGYSIGGFTGVGTARIDEFVTLNRLNTEYDGFINLTGIAAIVGFNKLSVGLTLGTDHLLDKNHSLWVNNGKPWIGLSVGLNLN